MRVALANTVAMCLSVLCSRPAGGNGYLHTALADLRALAVAQIAYRDSFNHGFACSLAKLGPNAQGESTAEAANYIDAKMASGNSPMGYKLTLRCTKGGFEALEIPPKGSGQAAYCMTEDMVIYAGKDGTAELCLQKKEQVSAKF